MKSLQDTHRCGSLCAEGEGLEGDQEATSAGPSIPSWLRSTGSVGGQGLGAGTSHPTCLQWSPGESRSFVFRVTRWQPKASFVFGRALQKVEMHLLLPRVAPPPFFFFFNSELLTDTVKTSLSPCSSAAEGGGHFWICFIPRLHQIMR